MVYAHFWLGLVLPVHATLNIFHHINIPAQCSIISVVNRALTTNILNLMSQMNFLYCITQGYR